MIQMICFLLALIFGIMATAAVPQPPRFGYLPFAVAMIALAFLVGTVPGLR